MKILVAHFRPDIASGAELAIGDMVDARSKGIEYLMLTPGKGRLAEYYRERGHAVWAKMIQTKRRKYPGLHSFQSLFYASRFRKRGIDAILCNTFPATSRVAHAARWAGIPYAMYVREYISKSSNQRTILAGADSVFAVSADVARHLADMVEPNRLVIARDHIESDPIRKRLAEHVRSGRHALPHESSVPVVGFIGRITRYKQPDLFLKAIPLVLAARPETRFVIVGKAIQQEEQFEKHLKYLARQLCVADKVAFLGQRDDALEILSELRVCCITSDREPYPRVVLEAQLAGCPVVASDTGGCPEMLVDGKTGLLFSPVRADSPTLLAEKILKVLGDESLASQMTMDAHKGIMLGAGSQAPVRHLEHLLGEMVRYSRGGMLPTADIKS
jgi:glycosyltransferase involved in cell wall biosynthesis